MESGRAPKAHVAISAVDVEAAPSPPRSRAARWAAVATTFFCVGAFAAAWGSRASGAVGPDANQMAYAFSPLPVMNPNAQTGEPSRVPISITGNEPSALSADRDLLNRRGTPEMIDKSKKIPNKDVWVTFASDKELRKGEIISGFQYGQEIAIVSSPKGGLFALSNKLPPTGQPATLAKIDDAGDGIIDPISGTVFSLKTGKVKGDWCPNLLGRLLFGRLIAPTDINVFKVRKQLGNIQVLINVNAKSQFEQNYWRGVLDSQGKVDGGYY